MEYRDVVVIGGGPSGLFSMFMLGQVGLTNCALIDSLEHLGGQCSALYPDKFIYDVAGFKQVYAQSLIDNLIEQMSQYNPSIRLNSKISNIEKKGDRFIVQFNGCTIETRAIIIASGVGAFAPKKPDLPEVEKYKNIHYKLENLSRFSGNVAVFGGGDSAVDWCLSLADYVNKVFLIHRRDKFRAMDGSMTKLYEMVNAGKAEILTPYTIHDADDADDHIHSIDIKHTKTKEITSLDVDAIIPCYGLQSDNELLYGLGVEMYGPKVIIDPATAKTSAEGIYCVGDASYYPDRHHLIVCGFSEAASASLHIRKNVFSETQYIKPPYI